ncbi:hypothetical protein SAMN05421770_101687 [Granulicella rosea]|uniref:Uncharacterized protein n=1 Tax=Granulicella rosea TaxID=474952 RepID=A0A239DXE4_9BACT|nr:hypothetical protein [Granulicella rosea]SNS36929.1 hypothetical protein SAMN05421770_101687 [Granulicella rosea]
MISLDSPEWSKLQHAYGAASDIPALLRGLKSFPLDDGSAEPWFTLWSSLAHQGDVYTASFAAVPHIVRMLEVNPAKASASFFSMPAWIEICRNKTSFEIPPALVQDYREALGKLPTLVAAAAARDWDADLLSGAMAALAAAKGFPVIAAAALELTPEIAKNFVEDYLFGK